MKKIVKRLVGLALAATMVVGMGVVSFAAGGRGAYETSFSGSAALSSMANDVFDGADMSYDEDEDKTTVIVYTKLYSRDYENSEGVTVTAHGWISSLTLDGVALAEASSATVDGTSYPTSFRAVFDGDLTAGKSFTASVGIKANGYEHNPQTGTLTLSK